MGRWIRWRAIAAVAAAAAVLPVSAVTSDTVERDRLQAEFIRRFPNYVEWPAGALDGDLQLCVVGDEAVETHLDSISDAREIRGHAVRVRHAPDDRALDACHVVYIGSGARDQVPVILGALGSRSVLTVSALRGFIESGGVIQFVQTGSKLRFEINQAAARAAGLRISAQLLKLAVAVHKAPEGDGR